MAKGSAFTWPGCLPGETAKQCRDRSKRESDKRKSEGKNKFDVSGVK